MQLKDGGGGICIFHLIVRLYRSMCVRGGAFLLLRRLIKAATEHEAGMRMMRCETGASDGENQVLCGKISQGTETTLLPPARSPAPPARLPLAWPPRSRPAPGPWHGCGPRCAGSSKCFSPPRSSFRWRRLEAKERAGILSQCVTLSRPRGVNASTRVLPRFPAPNRFMPRPLLPIG